ncbi:MAG: cytochrome c [Pseudomonadota bacterium]
MKPSSTFNKRSLHLLSLAPLGLLTLACGSGLGDPTGSTCPTDSTLTYAAFGQPFVEKYCLSCHGAGGPETPTLSTLAQIRSNLDVIDRAAAAGPKAVNTYMPDGGSVPEAERRLLGEWLACGAPQ